MNYIILDLEATCWQDKREGKSHEIIEIGALKVEQSGLIKSEFSEFVKPKLHPNLSEFCKALTTIEQTDIDKADTYDIVIAKFKEWIDLSKTFVLCSWGFYDKKQFVHDCDLYKLDKSWLSNHISLKHQYAVINQLKKPLGMNAALQREGLKLDGTHHRGIDDARNITKIFLAHLSRWKV